QDIHGIAIVPGNGRSSRMIASTNNDLNASCDGGETWQPLSVGDVLPWWYCRGLAQMVGRPEGILLGHGHAPPGTGGAAAHSTDGGVTWSEAIMPGRANSTIWTFAVHPADPEMVYAASVSGGVYRSIDGGTTWGKLPREFGEIRALAWTPEFTTP